MEALMLDRIPEEQTLSEQAMPERAMPEQTLADRFRSSRIGRSVAALALSVGLGGAGELAFADSSSAAETQPQTTEVSLASQLPNNVSLTFIGSESHSSVSASDVADGKVTVLSYIRANGLPKEYVNHNRCFWKSGVYNSGETINGPSHPTSANQVAWFYDSRDTYVCHVPKSLSPTGLAKAGNMGPNGQIVDDCGNFIMTTPPKKVIRGKVELVKSFAHAKLNIHAKAQAEAIGHDQNGQVCGTAEAEADAHLKVNVKQYLKHKGAAAVRFYDKLLGKADAHAHAKVNCGASTTVITKEATPPPQTPPTPPVTPPEQAPTESLVETMLTTAEPLFTNSPEQLCVDAEQINTDASGNSSTSVPNVTFNVVSGEGTVSGTFGDQDGDPNHVCATFTSGPDVGQSEIDAVASSNDGGTEPAVTQQFTIATMQDSGF